jgi:hypothetical protein
MQLLQSANEKEKRHETMKKPKIQGGKTLKDNLKLKHLVNGNKT